MDSGQAGHSKPRSPDAKCADGYSEKSNNAEPLRGCADTAGAIDEGRMSEDGARYAIIVDGIVRTHRDTLEVALEAASVLNASGAISQPSVEPCT